VAVPRSESGRWAGGQSFLGSLVGKIAGRVLALVGMVLMVLTANVHAQVPFTDANWVGIEAKFDYTQLSHANSLRHAIGFGLCRGIVLS